MQTKKSVLIKEFNKNLEINAYYNPSPWNIVALIEWDDEHVFGYYQYSDKVRKFFKVKWNENKSFTLSHRTYGADLFLRQTMKMEAI